MAPLSPMMSKVEGSGTRTGPSSPLFTYVRNIKSFPIEASVLPFR